MPQANGKLNNNIKLLKINLNSRLHKYVFILSLSTSLSILVFFQFLIKFEFYNPMIFYSNGFKNCKRKTLKDTPLWQMTWKDYILGKFCFSFPFLLLVFWENQMSLSRFKRILENQHWREIYFLLITFSFLRLEFFHFVYINDVL